MVKISIVKTGITNLTTDAIVNAANENLAKGSGVCGVSFNAAGPQELQTACSAIGHCETGDAVITPGFRLQSKYIIHAVGPRWTDGKHGEPALLYNAYKKALSLAVSNGCKSIGFPLVSAGAYGYPVEKAWNEAIRACLDFKKSTPRTELDIQFAVIDDKVLETGKKVLADLKLVRTTQFLCELEEDSFQNIRQKVSKDHVLLLDERLHPMAGGLMRVICNPAITDLLSVEMLINTIDSIFPDSVLDENWISRYGDIILRIVDESKKSNPIMRAERYEKYLRDVLVPALKAGTHSNDVMDDLEPLKDVYKAAVCLFRYYTDKEKQFVFKADRDDMDRFNQSIWGIRGVGNPLLGLELAPVRTEERPYAIFLSWVLEEMLIKDESIKVEF